MIQELSNDLTDIAEKYQHNMANIQGREATGSKLAKAQKAKSLVLENSQELYFTSFEEVFVKIDIGDRTEIVSTGSKQFKRWLIFLFEMTENTMLADSDIKTVISSIDSFTTFRGKKRDIYLRIAEVDGKIYLDLCNDKQQVLEISAEGFQVLDESPVLFRRTSDMAELPIPIFRKEQDYQLLGNYLNFSKMEDLDMIVSFLLGSFRPIMPKPLLNLTGEAGTGKSMNTRLIRSFIDPAKQKDLLKKEIDMRELPLSASSQYLLAFDNLSGISKEGSDLLCVVSTGGVMTTRKLYTDSDEVIVDLKKAVILNGIDEISKREDLVSRTLFIETPKLDDATKKTEAEIWEGFYKDYPYIFGALVNAVSVGLRNKGKDKTAYTRMQDFGRFIADCSEGLGWEQGYWQEIYPNNQQTGIEQSINSDPFASSLVDMMEQFKRDGLETWEGTATDLLTRLAKDLPSDETTYNPAWPKRNKVKGRLRRIAPSLNSRGIKWSDERNGNERLIRLTIDL